MIVRLFSDHLSAYRVTEGSSQVFETIGIRG